MQDYIINTSAPQIQRFYDWQKDNNKWCIKKEYCGNCHANLNWKWGLMYFCPKCGFRLIGVNNPNPPEEEQ